MRDDLLGLLERADLALGSAAGVIDDDTLEPLIRAVRAVRTRLSYPESVPVVALAGGTGSGKSSLFNALAGEELVDVGGVRPTTSTPAAAVPVTSGDAFDGYLDRLDVQERHEHTGPSICFLDLPDTDSVELDHRYRVDALLPLVDMVIWVADPEKYRDARLHGDYLQPMSDYSDQYIFVLNQIDRLTDDEVTDVLADFAAAVEDDGIDSAEIIPTAAFTPSGPPIGVEELVAAIEEKRRGRQVLHGKLLSDLEATCLALETAVGEAGLDFDRRAEGKVDRAARLLISGDPDAAANALVGFLDDLVAGVGGVSADKLRAVAADVPTHVRRIEAELGSVQRQPKRRWFRRGQQADEAAPLLDDARSGLSQSVIRPARAVLARRALAVASIAELAVEVARLRSAG